MTRKFTLDRANGKLMGVCAGLAAATDTDPTLVRLAAILTLFLVGPVAIFLYLVAAWVAPDAQ
jgi:phage shock protein PspC (stress-responsive transcriptional regulator)